VSVEETAEIALVEPTEATLVVEKEELFDQANAGRWERRTHADTKGIVFVKIDIISSPYKLHIKNGSKKIATEQGSKLPEPWHSGASTFRNI